ncbi:hypothetical protein [Streptomyces broussonetiae]|uniref:MarR family transcriptional regulator n=1 Tax=Streptomyces broussonetiae TaxID=2686304 RepID=A0ABV5EF09_9ACTN
MRTALDSPRPQGTPRWVLMAHQPATGTWHTGAEPPYRAPVLHALGEMTRTVRARGDDLTTALWGPDDHDGTDWRRHDPAPASTAETPAATAPPATAPPAPRPAAGSTALTERPDDRRQVLLAGLTRAGHHDLTADDLTAVQTLVERLDETTLRTLAHWLARR